MKYVSDEPDIVADLLTLAQAYADATGLAIATISRRAHGDSPALMRLAKGAGSITLRKRKDVIAWFHEHWPKGVPMPRIGRYVPARKRKGKQS